MQQAEQKFYLVEATALPEILHKVLAAKELLETGSAQTVAEAVARVNLSRSAFYKYRDAVSPFFDASAGRIITFHVLLKNRSGALSAVLGIFSNFGANILTINQSIPVRGRAVVTISAETHEVTDGLERLLSAAEAYPDVIRIEVMAG